MIERKRMEAAISRSSYGLTADCSAEAGTTRPGTKRLSLRTIPKVIVALKHGKQTNQSLIDVITAASCLPNERTRSQLVTLQRFLGVSPTLAACPAWQQTEFARVVELHAFESGQVVSSHG